MTFSEECALACYEQIAALSEEHGVWLVQHRTSRAVYVRKVLSIYNRSVYQYLKEHRIPGTPEIVELAEDEGKLIVIEEYISGQTLASLLQNCGGVLSEAEAVPIVIRLCRILRELHSCSPAIVHRDIKPSNIILTSEGDVKLIDMNAAKTVQAGKAADTALIGTAGYAAPEQYGFGASDIRADIYSVGVLLNEMLTGASPAERMAEGRLGEIVRRCTRMDPADRYESADALIKDLAGQAKPARQKPYRSPRFMIPGFRSGNVSNMVIAVLGYGFIFFFGSTMQIQNSRFSGQLWVERVFFMISALVAVFFICNYRNIWHVLQIDRIRHPLLRALAVLAATAVLVVMLLLVMSLIEAMA